EDGIRDRTVTGVQTCALPIFKAMATPAAADKRFLVLADGPTISWLQLARILRDRLGPLAERVPTEETPGAELPNLVIHNERAKRSEERRVGKECRKRGWGEE